MLFFHGLESGPNGSKYRELTAAFGEIEAPDFRGLTLNERLVLAEKVTRGRTGLLVVGSSFGGLVAALLASACPDRIAGYVLCAPDFRQPDSARIARVPARAMVVHGEMDEVVPLQKGIEFSLKFCIPLVQTPDDHRLKASVPQILDAVRYIMA